jgi:hypothetical protein
MPTATTIRLRDHCLAPERVDQPASMEAATAACSTLRRAGAAGGLCDGGDCKDDPPSRRAGRPSANTSPMTSPPTGHRCARTPTSRRCGTCAPRARDGPQLPVFQRAKPIDGTLPRSLIGLPRAIAGAVDDEAFNSLTARALERGEGTGLPSGESVARLLGVAVLDQDELDLTRHGWRGETPLWLYILREAAERAQVARLGPVGGRIVGEVLITIIARFRSRISRSTDRGGRRSQPTRRSSSCATCSCGPRVGGGWLVHGDWSRPLTQRAADPPAGRAQPIRPPAAPSPA